MKYFVRVATQFYNVMKAEMIQVRELKDYGEALDWYKEVTKSIGEGFYLSEGHTHVMLFDEEGNVQLEIKLEAKNEPKRKVNVSKMTKDNSLKPEEYYNDKTLQKYEGKIDLRK